MSLKVCQASTWWGSHWELRGAIRSTSASTIKHFEKSYMVFRKKKKKPQSRFTGSAVWSRCLRHARWQWQLAALAWRYCLFTVWAAQSFLSSRRCLVQCRHELLPQSAHDRHRNKPVCYGHTPWGTQPGRGSRSCGRRVASLGLQPSACVSEAVVAAAHARVAHRVF